MKFKNKIQAINGWIEPTDERFLLAEFKDLFESACGRICGINVIRDEPYGIRAMIYSGSAELSIHSFPEEGKSHICFVAGKSIQAQAFIELAKERNLMPQA